MADYKLPPFTTAELLSAQAVMNANADSDQQRMFIRWLMREATLFNGVHHSTPDLFDAGRLEGRRYVGYALVTMMAGDAIEKATDSNAFKAEAAKDTSKRRTTTIRRQKK